MPENETGARDRVIRGVEEVGRGVGEVGRGVRDAAESVAENLKETIKSKTSGDRQNRDNVVMVRVDKDSLDRLDDLVEAGVAGSRSEAASYLITEGIKSRQVMFDTITAKVEEIRKAKEELKDLLEQE